MGGSYNYSKGNGNGNGSNNSRGRSYGLMLVMAFGAALLGVMVLHKLRERRIFNLLLQEKDSDLISLHLLLQKERDYAKELKRNNEEMKTKMYSIRTQKMELDRKTLELKSTVDSLKEELQTMEAAVEEKQNEIKMLRENSENGNPQVMELLESLKQKEGEIEDLKHRLEYPVKVWSASTDDPSKPLANLTLSEGVPGIEKAAVTESTKEADRLQESASNEDVKKTRPDEDGSGNKSISLGEGDADRGERMANQSEKLDDSQDGNVKHGSTDEEGQGKKGGDFKDGGDFRIGNEESNLAKAAEVISDTNRKDVDHEVFDGEESKITGNGHVGNIGKSEPGESQKLHASGEGGRKLEMPDKRNGDRRKKWREIAKQRRLENREHFRNNGVGSVKSRRFFKVDRNGFMGREEEAASNRGLRGDNHSMEVREALDPSDAKNLELQNTEDLKNKLAHVDTSDANGKSSGTTEEHEALNIQQQNLKNSDINQPEIRAERVKSADANDLQEDLEVADAEEQEKDATDDNLFDEPGSKLEDKEEYREEIDESEF